MTQAIITVYPHIKEVKEGSDIPVDVFLRYIQEGRWQDKVLKIRTIKDKESRQNEKKKLPYACMSGTFDHRNISGLREHSGFICLDFDGVDNPEAFKERISKNEYVYAAFVSCSGNGLAVMVRIPPDKHNEVFDALSEYFFTQFGAVASTDKSCRDVSRARYVSFDPALYLNHDAKKWTRVAKRAAEKPAPKVVFVQSDFDAIISEINHRGVDICPSYHDWLRVGFALASHFGERGRAYFEIISYNWANGRASSEQINRQYNECLKDQGTGNKVTIATFYHYCRQNNVSTYSAQTKAIAQAATIARKDHRDKKSVLKYLNEEGYADDEIIDIVNQVYEKGISVEEDSEIELIEHWLKQNYGIRKNKISRAIELDGEEADDAAMKDVWRKALRVFPKITYNAVKQILTSKFAPEYNPFAEFFAKYADLPPDPGIIERYFGCIRTDTAQGHPTYGPDVYVRYFGRKWLIGVISNAHYDECNLLLVLSGVQKTGKTSFFRRMIPQELKRYYAQSRMDAGKDDLILMAKRFVIFDDELAGKSKREEKSMKDILSKDIITLREPYGHATVDLRRIATFCGCSNEDELLHDPTGNRRVIPINVLSIDFATIDQIDRVQLFVEAYRAWRAGETWELDDEALELLASAGKPFEARTAEEEAILDRYRLPMDGEKPETFPTALQIHARCMEKFGNVFTYNNIKRALRKLNWKSEQRRVNGENARRYPLISLV